MSKTPPLSPQRLASLEAEMDDAGVRDIYDQLVADGQHPNSAAMFATQQCASTWNTDADFNKREKSRMDSMQEETRDEIVYHAQQAGINTHGKTYNGSLGTYKDPHAWVSSTNDVKKVAEAKGLDIDGMVKANYYKGPKKKVRMAEDIVDAVEMRRRLKDPRLNDQCKKSEKARRQLRDEIVEKHSKPKD